MNRHQRCLAAISGQTPDRTPTYLPAIACKVASKLLGRPAYGGTGSLHYAEVLAWSKGQAAHDEFEAKLFQDLLDIQRLLDIDVMRSPWRMNRKPSRAIDEFTFVFGDEKAYHEIWTFEPSSGDFGMVKAVGGIDDPEQWLEQTLKEEEASAANAAAHQQTHRRAHENLVKRFGQEFFTVSIYGGVTAGIDEISLMALAIDPQRSARRMVAQAQHAIEWGRWLASTDFPRVMLGGGDMASTQGPMYSPESFRQVLLPAYTSMARELNAVGVHYGFRSDGQLGPVADMLFKDAGIPGYGEVDRDAGMTVEILRKKFPDLVIWGHFSSAFLASTTPAQIKDECKKILEANGPTRYFHSCSNAILQTTPPENVIAMYSVR